MGFIAGNEDGSLSPVDPVGILEKVNLEELVDLDHVVFDIEKLGLIVLIGAPHVDPERKMQARSSI